MVISVGMLPRVWHLGNAFCGNARLPPSSCCFLRPISNVTVRFTCNTRKFCSDEFIVVITELNKSLNVEDLKTRLTRSIAQPITTSHGEFSVGVSIGHASFPIEGKSLEELIHLADERMFERKRISHI